MLRAGLPRTPPHCPNRDCDSHTDPRTWHFVKKGFFSRQRRPRRVQRYRCSHCGVYFSTQTFSPTYWLKRPDLLKPLFFRTLACSAYRQIAREFRLAHTTVQHQVSRLGRHCLLLLEELRPRDAIVEALVLDGFRSLESGHYWPFDLNLFVGAESHFVYGFQDAELRRSGTMRPGQRRHRERLEARYGRPDPAATRNNVRELATRVIPPQSEVTIRTDEHLAYPPALRELPGERRVVHETTSSRAARTARNPLFAVNLADLLLRHCGANHKRETIAFSKRRQGALYRAAIFAVWRNYMKSLSERRRDAPPGVRLGVIGAPLAVEQVLGQRRFPWKAPLTGWLERCYYGRIPTRCLPNAREHRLRYAA